MSDLQSKFDSLPLDKKKEVSEKLLMMATDVAYLGQCNGETMAFPGSMRDLDEAPGLTKREYIATKLFAAYLSDPEVAPTIRNAARAVAAADLLLTALAKSDQ